MNSAMWIGILFLSFLVQVTAATPTPYFLVIFPRTIPADGGTKACIHIGYLDEPLKLRFTLQTRRVNITLLEEFVPDIDWHRCITFKKFFSGVAADGLAKLKVSGESDTYKFEKIKKVYMASHSSSGTFVPTVKPVSKPDQEVLPRADVQIKLPRVVSVMDHEFILSVCGRYTDGKPVHGTALVSICRNSQYYWSKINSSEISTSYCKEFNSTTDSSGCFSKVINTIYFHLRTPLFNMEFNINVMLIEDGTGQKMMAFGKVPVSQFKAKVTLEDMQGNFKNGIPFKGQIYAEDMYGSPIAGADIILSYHDKNEMLLTDEKGQVCFNFNTSAWANPVNRISATLKNCNSARDNERNRIINLTCVHKEVILKRHYSKSKSYLQIRREVTSEVQRDLSLKIHVDYIFTQKALVDNPGRLVFFYLVMAGKRVILEGRIPSNVTTSHRAQGSFSFDIPMATKTTPKVNVLMYVVLPNGELLANSREFKIPRNLESKVLDEKVYHTDEKKTHVVHYLGKEPSPCILPDSENIQNRTYFQVLNTIDEEELDAYSIIWDMGLDVSTNTAMRKQVSCKPQFAFSVDASGQRACGRHCISKCISQTDWTLFQNSFYYFSSCKLNWEDSRIFCLANDADLVVINNLEEKNFLRGKISQSYWIGLTDQDEEGQWYWVDGTSYNITSGFWCAGEPNNVASWNDKGEDCATIWINQDCPGTLNDDSCPSSYYFICEKQN